MIKNKQRIIPRPAISRLCKIYSLLNELEEKGEAKVSSRYMGKRMGIGSHNIRKDISYLGEAGTTGAGYEIQKLKSLIESNLGFQDEHSACLIGLGGLGIALMNDQKLLGSNFKIVAGFDSNINKLETIKSDFPVYPTYEIKDIVKNKGIELAVITEANINAQTITERLIEGGIKGIVNFSNIILSTASNNVFIKNIDLINEFRFLSSLFNLDNKKR